MDRIPRSMKLSAVAGMMALCFCTVAQAQVAGVAQGSSLGQGTRMFLPGYRTLSSGSVQK